MTVEEQPTWAERLLDVWDHMSFEEKADDRYADPFDLSDDGLAWRLVDDCGFEGMTIRCLVDDYADLGDHDCDEQERHRSDGSVVLVCAYSGDCASWPTPMYGSNRLGPFLDDEVQTK